MMVDIILARSTRKSGQQVAAEDDVISIASDTNLAAAEDVISMVSDDGFLDDVISVSSDDGL